MSRFVEVVADMSYHDRYRFIVGHVFINRKRSRYDTVMYLDGEFFDVCRSKTKKDALAKAMDWLAWRVALEDFG